MNLIPLILLAIAAFSGGAFVGAKVDNVIEQRQVVGLNKQIDGLRQQIDGPTGYIKQIGAINNANATLRDNLTGLKKSLNTQNGQITALKAEADKRAAAQRQALADLAASERSASQLAEAIRTFQPRADACTDAVTLLREAGR